MVKNIDQKTANKKATQMLRDQDSKVPTVIVDVA